MWAQHSVTEYLIQQPCTQQLDNPPNLFFKLNNLISFLYLPSFFTFWIFWLSGCPAVAWGDRCYHTHGFSHMCPCRGMGMCQSSDRQTWCQRMTRYASWSSRNKGTLSRNIGLNLANSPTLSLGASMCMVSQVLRQLLCRCSLIYFPERRSRRSVTVTGFIPDAILWPDLVLAQSWHMGAW